MGGAVVASSNPWLKQWSEDLNVLAGTDAGAFLQGLQGRLVHLAHDGDLRADFVDIDVSEMRARYLGVVVAPDVPDGALAGGVARTC